MASLPDRAALGFGHHSSAKPKSKHKVSKKAAAHVKKHRKAPPAPPTAATPPVAGMSPVQGAPPMGTAPMGGAPPSPMASADQMSMDNVPGLSGAQ